MLQLRRMLLTADAWVYQRHWKTLFGYPWRLAIIADLRATLEMRLVEAELFLAACLWCLDPYWGRRFRALFPHVTAHELCTDRFYQKLFFNWVRSVLVHIGVVENIHAANRINSCAKNAWHNFVGKFVNQEAASHRRVRARMLELHQDSVTKPSEDVTVGEDGEFLKTLLAYKQAQTPKQIVRLEVRLEWKRGGKKVQLFEELFMAEVTKRFDSLDVHGLKRVCALADMTTASAQHNKLLAAKSSSSTEVADSNLACPPVAGTCIAVFPSARLWCYSCCVLLVKQKKGCCYC